jgi:hypothetical protein
MTGAQRRDCHPERSEGIGVYPERASRAGRSDFLEDPHRRAKDAWPPFPVRARLLGDARAW